MIEKNFEKLDFNRKIDVLVALHIFNILDIEIEWHEFKNLGEKKGYWSVYYWVPMAGGIGKVSTNVPLYSVLLTSAWDIVKKFKFFYMYRAEFINGGKWECKLHSIDGDIQLDTESDGRKYYGVAETEQLAICYAGLKAVGYPGYPLEEFIKGERA